MHDDSGGNLGAGKVQGKSMSWYSNNRNGRQDRQRSECEAEGENKQERESGRVHRYRQRLGNGRHECIL
jgi:hypothetical protein